jgi:hypothetical protein
LQENREDVPRTLRKISEGCFIFLLWASRKRMEIARVEVRSLSSVIPELYKWGTMTPLVEALLNAPHYSSSIVMNKTH